MEDFGWVWFGANVDLGVVSITVEVEVEFANDVSNVIWEILLLKVRRKEWQRSGEEGGLIAGGWSSLTVENRMRGFWLVLLMRVEKWADLAAWRASQ